MNESTDIALTLNDDTPEICWCEDCNRVGEMKYVAAEWNPSSENATRHKWVCAKGCIVQCTHCMSLLQLFNPMMYNDIKCCICDKMFRASLFCWYGHSESEMDRRFGDYNYHDTSRFRLLEQFCSLRQDIKCEIKSLLLIANRFGIKLPNEVLTIICEDLFIAERRFAGSLQDCLITMMDYGIGFRCRFQNDPSMPSMEFSMSVDFDDEQNGEAKIYVQVEELDEEHDPNPTAGGTFICNYNGEILGDWPTISNRYGHCFDFSLKDLAVDFFVDDYHRYIRQLQVLKEVLMMLTRTCLSRDVRILIGKFMRADVRKEFLGLPY